VISIPDLAGDIDWGGSLAGVDVVVHLAARVHIVNDNAPDLKEQYRAVNVQATMNLALQSVEAGVKRFVFISSVKVNGELTPAKRPFTEGDSPNPSDAYGISKAEAEASLRQLATNTGLEVVIVRPPLVYGPGVKANFAALMRAVLRCLPLPLARVDNLRSLISIDNLVDIIIRCTSHPNAANQTFLVSDNHDVSTPDLVRTMSRAAKLPDRLFPVPVSWLRFAATLIGRRSAVDRLCGNLQLDISKVKTLLSWIPPVSLEEGIRRTMSSDQL